MLESGLLTGWALMLSLRTVTFLLIISLLITTGCQKTPPGMVLIPVGDFIMGTDQVDEDQEALAVGFPHPWYEDEHPQHKVYLHAYYIDRSEVTNVQYQKFITATGYHPPQNWPNATYPKGNDELPVVYVNWYDADAYCRWLGKRLPLEAEWEKAARGSDGRKYPWGNTFNPLFANIAREAVMFAQPTPVRQFESGKSPYGVYDMIGNVWEWTDSWYEPYSGNKAQNENFGQKLKVTRGLSFMSVGHFSSEDYSKVSSIVARTSFRSYDFLTSRLADVGFRCVKSLK